VSFGLSLQKEVLMRRNSRMRAASRGVFDRPLPDVSEQLPVSLTGLELEDFKAFGASINLPLSPITIVFGENSARKSSIIQSMQVLQPLFCFDRNDECFQYLA